MPVVRYMAKRSLISGVTEGDLITHDLPVAYAGMNRTRRVYATTRRALSGARETYHENSENSWDIRTPPLEQAEYAPLVMFLESVEAGEAFEFAPDGAAGDPVIAWRSARMDSSGYEERRHDNLDSLMQYSFTIVEAP